MILKAVKQFAPELYTDLRKIQSDFGSPTFEKTLDTIYRAVDSISVDYGIMERADNIYLVEGNFEWNDLGGWESVYQLSEKDENGNASSGESVFLNTENSFIYSDKGLVALVGLEDVIVVKEGDVTLVCKRDKTEQVKKIVEQLRLENRNQFL